MREIKHAERKVVAAMSTLEQLGYTYHGGELWKPPIAEAIKEPKTKDWPQIGDEVAITGSDCKFNLISINNGRAWIERSYSDSSVVNTETHEPLEIFESHIVFIDELKKPLTPEEELAKELEKMVYDAMDNAFGPTHNTEYLVSGLMKKYDIKKKSE